MDAARYSPTQATAAFDLHWKLRDEIDAKLAALNDLQPDLEQLRRHGFQPEHEIADGIKPADVRANGTWHLVCR